MGLQNVLAKLKAQGVDVILTVKSVKNINFRIKQGVCHISTPAWVSEQQLATAIAHRQAWIVASCNKLSQRQPVSPMLWGRQIDVRQMASLLGLWIDGADDETVLLAIYHQQMSLRLVDLADKWQPIVGRYASDIRLKKMRSRWGSCHTKRGSISLSVYLAAYPYECLEYVFVHELCHLHHAHHQPSFWEQVAKAMPDYRIWHDLLKSGNPSLGV